MHPMLQNSYPRASYYNTVTMLKVAIVFVPISLKLFFPILIYSVSLFFFTFNSKIFFTFFKSKNNKEDVKKKTTRHNAFLCYER